MEAAAKKKKLSDRHSSMLTYEAAFCPPIEVQQDVSGLTDDSAIDEGNAEQRGQSQGTTESSSSSSSHQKKPLRLRPSPTSSKRLKKLRLEDANGQVAWENGLIEQLKASDEVELLNARARVMEQENARLIV